VSVLVLAMAFLAVLSFICCLVLKLRRSEGPEGRQGDQGGHSFSRTISKSIVMTDKNRKWYAEPEGDEGQWQRTSNTNEGTDEAASQNVVITNDVATTDEPLDDGTVAVGSGLGIDE